MKKTFKTIKDIVKETPLLESVRMSDKTGANVFLKWLRFTIILSCVVGQRPRLWLYFLL